MECRRCHEEKAIDDAYLLKERLCEECCILEFNEVADSICHPHPSSPRFWPPSPSQLREFRDRKIGGVSVVTTGDRDWLKDYARIIW